MLELASSRIVALPQQDAFERTLARDLPEMFVRGAGPIPAVRETEHLAGTWSAVGDRRRIVLKDGTSSVETMTSCDPPHGWTYALSELSGPMKLLVGDVQGRFSFVPRGAGTEVTWSWKLRPSNPVTGPLLHLVGFFWKKYAAAGLAELDRRITAA